VIVVFCIFFPFCGPSMDLFDLFDSFDRVFASDMYYPALCICIDCFAFDH
jgi:hypothetical protein